MPDEDLSKLRIDKSAKTFRPRRRLKPVYFVIALAVIVLVYLYLRGDLTPAQTVEISHVTQIYPSQTLSQLTASGYVVAQRKSAVAAKITGRLVELLVEEGSRVKEGQVIARLENEDVKAAREQARANLKFARENLEQAKADLEDATRTFQRNKDLVARGFIARSEYDTSEARFQKTRAAVSAAEASIKANQAALQGAEVAVDYTLIRAPFDAVVLTKNADIGDIVTPIGAAANAKSAVVTIADMNSLEVETDVSETNLSIVTTNQPCEIRLDALPNSPFRGSVHTIVPTVDRSKATVTVKVRFLKKDPRILPDMRAKVSFLSRPVRKEEEKLRTVVNQAAVVSRDGRSVVFRVNENRAMDTPVRLGEKFGDMVEVLEGAKAGDPVVLHPAQNLKNGSRVKAAEK